MNHDKRKNRKKAIIILSVTILIIAAAAAVTTVVIRRAKNSDNKDDGTTVNGGRQDYSQFQRDASGRISVSGRGQRNGTSAGSFSWSGSRDNNGISVNNEIPGVLPSSVDSAGSVSGGDTSENPDPAEGSGSSGDPENPAGSETSGSSESSGGSETQPGGLTAPVRSAPLKSAPSGAPGAILDLNLQNYTIITDTEHDWYGSRPTQKGLYQIAADYIEDEGVSFKFIKNGSHADPMIFLPVYDICYNINLKDYPYFAVCYKSTATNSNGVCYFATSANAGLGEDKNFGINMQPSEDWTIATANAGKNKNWTGRLTALRFDISSGEFSGAYTVKWIGFFKTENDALAYGTYGTFSNNEIVPDKDVFGRGENITFSVTDAGKGDWVVLVQKGDACYAPSVNRPDLYVSTCMPLYYAPLDGNRGDIDIDLSGGVYNGQLLPAGEYDLVYMPRGRFVETARTTITINEEIVREPAVNEIIYVTRGPAPTEEPAATEEPDEEPTAVPTATDGRQRITHAPTAVPADNSSGSAGLIIAICALALCGAALATFFIVRGKRRAGDGQ